MMQRLSPSDQRALKVGGYGVGAILLTMLVFFPATDHWKKVTSRRTEAEKKAKDIRTKVSDATDVQVLSLRLEDQARILKDLTELKQETARLLAQVEGIPEYANLAVRRLEGLALRDDGTHYRSAVSLQFVGTVTHLNDFLEAVKNETPALRVDRFTMSTAEDDAGKIKGQLVIFGCAVVLDKPKPTRGNSRA